MRYLGGGRHFTFTVLCLYSATAREMDISHRGFYDLTSSRYPTHVIEETHGVVLLGGNVMIRKGRAYDIMVADHPYPTHNLKGCEANNHDEDAPIPRHYTGSPESLTLPSAS